MECKGFLFDLDGTLVDSLKTVENTWINWAKLRQLSVEEVLSYIHGKQAVTSLRHFLPAASEQEIQAEFKLLEKIESEDVKDISALPGAIVLLDRISQLNIPWAIVTSGSIPVAHARHKAGNLPQPHAFVTAELVSRGKPEPDAFLLGAEKLGLSPSECVVVEDADAGVRSGLAAGCQVIAVNAILNHNESIKVAKQLHSLDQIRLEKESGMVKITFIN